MLGLQANVVIVISSVFIASLSRSSRRNPSPPDKTLRDRLLELISLKPGVRMSTLWKTLDADRGTAKYHLVVLERSREVEVVRAKGLTRYFPAGTQPTERVALTLLRHGRVAEVAKIVADRPGVAQHDITNVLPISRKVFRRYANLLIACQLLEEVPQDQQRYYYATPRLRKLLYNLEREHDSGSPGGTP